MSDTLVPAVVVTGVGDSGLAINSEPKKACPTSGIATKGIISAYESRGVGVLPESSTFVFIG